MKPMEVRPSGPLRGETSLPGDKSISHRALLLGALAQGETRVHNFLRGADCLATRGCLEGLGIRVDDLDDGGLVVHGRGLRGLSAPEKPLNCVRSGTTIRLIAGLLAGQPFSTRLEAEPQLARRPMRRVVEPLRQMGADIEDTEGRPPLTVRPATLRGMRHDLRVASAQVKSALLLAGLQAEGRTSVREPGPARDHTERMLAAMGARCGREGGLAWVEPGGELAPLDLLVPGDASSAAFVIAAATIVPGSVIRLTGVGVNPTRTGFIDALLEMGADIRFENEREMCNEPVADLVVRSAALKGASFSGDLIVRAIDELPLLAFVAALADGPTVVHDAQELRVKETDRIAVVVEELTRLGAAVEALPDGFMVSGGAALRGCPVSAHGDHRLAMSLAVAGLAARDPLVIDDMDCSGDSFPGFAPLMRALGADYA